jgi:hypothetical protein
VKSLDITMGGITTSVTVAAENPPRWSLGGGEPQSPGVIIRELFAQAHEDGVSNAAIMAPRVTYLVDGTPQDPPMAVLAWLHLSR